MKRTEKVETEIEAKREAEKEIERGKEKGKEKERIDIVEEDPNQELILVLVQARILIDIGLDQNLITEMLAKILIIPECKGKTREKM